MPLDKVVPVYNPFEHDVRVRLQATDHFMTPTGGFITSMVVPAKTTVDMPVTTWCVTGRRVGLLDCRQPKTKEILDQLAVKVEAEVEKPEPTVSCAEESMPEVKSKTKTETAKRKPGRPRKKAQS